MGLILQNTGIDSMLTRMISPDIGIELQKGYQYTEVGIIPEDWIVKTVGEMAEVKTGPFGSALHEKDYVDNGTPIITVEHLGERGVHYENLPLVGASDKHRLRAYLLRKGDIVFSRVGSVDRNAIIKDGEDGWLFSGRLLRVRPIISDIYAPYLSFHFHTEGFKQRVKNVAVGQTMASLNTQILKGVKAVIPSTKVEQIAIAEALSDADTLIEALEQLIAKKRQVKQGAMQELFKGEPHWDLIALGDIADPHKKWSFTGGPFGSNLKSSDYTKKGVRIIQLQNIGDGEFKNDYEIFTSDEKADELLSCNIYPGDIILSKMGDPVARACIIPSYETRYLMCSDGIRFAVDLARFNSFFVYIAINAVTFRTNASNAGTGTTRKRIGLTQLRNLTIACPSIGKQQEIAAIISAMDAEISELKTKLSKARLLKKGMMQELLTGRIRLV